MSRNSRKTNLKRNAVIATTVAIAALATYTTFRGDNSKVEVESLPALETNYQSQNQNEDQRNIASYDTREQCKIHTLPSFANISLTWAGSLFGEALSSLSPPVVPVIAAGNKHPKPIRPEKVKASEDFDAIIVGSLAPDGKRSWFSNEHEEVHIMAPSDYYINSANENGNRERFGGTSGAAPLVTGSLAGFEWLSGYHPTAEESKVLLEKTAIITQHSHDEPRKHGAGIANAYKLGMLGKKLKELCGTDKYCFKDKIQEDSTYDFPEDEGVLEAVHSAFPECSPDNCSNTSSVCADKAEAFKRLRKAAFLNPSDKKLWKYVACIYNSSGFTKNAEGTASIYKSLFGPDQNNTPAYTFCRVDTDCTIIPSSDCGDNPKTIPFLAATLAESDIYYNKQHCSPKKPLCNGKCRCENQETAELNSEMTTYTTRCFNFKCVLNTDMAVGISSPREPSSQDETSSKQ